MDTLSEFNGLLFADLFTEDPSTNSTYQEILSYENLRQSCEEALNKYNKTSKQPMSLVLFDYAIHHLLRIRRILNLPKGHALLVGINGSGRSSLTRLASSISDYEIF